jgi:hypothetical protein
MNEEQRAAFQIAQASCAMIEALGMLADNQQATIRGETAPFHKANFDDLIDRYGIGHNAAVTWLTGQ